MPHMLKCTLPSKLSTKSRAAQPTVIFPGHIFRSWSAVVIRTSSGLYLLLALMSVVTCTEHAEGGIAGNLSKAKTAGASPT